MKLNYDGENHSRQVNKKKLRQHIDTIINEHPGYSQVPNFIYELGLSKHELVVIHYLIRCANRKNGGTCYPSIKDISKKCSIPSGTTVGAAIRGLQNKGLITKVTRRRRSNIYTISKDVYIAIDKANKIPCNLSVSEEISTYSGGIENEAIEVSVMATDGDEIATHSDAPHQHMVMPNKTNGTRITDKNKEDLKNNPSFIPTVEVDYNSRGDDKIVMPIKRRVSTYGKNSATGKRNTLAEANEYYLSLTESQKKTFDNAARALLHPDEPNPKGSIKTSRNIRRRFFELLNIKPIRLKGDELFCVPPEYVETASEQGGKLSRRPYTPQDA